MSDTTKAKTIKAKREATEMGVSMTYAIPDLHGRLDLLIGALDAIEKDVEAHGPTGRRIIFLGDMVDRGPDSRHILRGIRILAENKACAVLMGNHERMMIEALKDLGKSLAEQVQKAEDTGEFDKVADDELLGFRLDEPSAIVDSWFRNGGGATLASYGERRTVDGEDVVAITKDALLAAIHDAMWLEDLPHVAIDDHRIYVHAMVDETIDLADHHEGISLWGRYDPDNADVGYRGKHVVHGHEIHEDGPLLLKNRTCLDIGSFLNGRLAVGVFDDAVPGGPVRVLTVVGDDVRAEVKAMVAAATATP